MKNGIAYRLGDGPLLMDVPVVGTNGMSAYSKTVRLEGDLLNVYYATQKQSEAEKE